MIPIGKVQTALRLEISVMIQPLRTPASNVEHDFPNIFSGLKSKKLAVTKKKQGLEHKLQVLCQINCDYYLNTLCNGQHQLT